MSIARPAALAPISFAEIVAYGAAVTALSALSIDIMLPALGLIREEFRRAAANDAQLVVFAFLAGYGAVQILIGPIADRIGRRAVTLWSLALFIAASIASALAPTFLTLVVARAAQGAAVASSRVAIMAMLRDLYAGREMARVVSIVTVVFMAAPILAPALGQVALAAGPWRLIFIGLAVYGAALFVWTLVRTPETLAADKRAALSLKTAIASYATFVRTRGAIGYSLSSACVFGAFFAYLGTAQQIYVGQFGLGPLFPAAFGAGAIPFAAAAFLNARLVRRLGMRKLVHGALALLIAVNLAHVAAAASGAQSAALYLGFMGASMFALGFVGGNSTAIAMDPMGRIAGAAAAAHGFITSAGAAALGAAAGRLYQGSTGSVALAFVLFGGLALFFCYWAEHGRLFREGGADAAPVSP